MKFFISRYLVNFIAIMIGVSILWAGCIYWFDGLIPMLGALVFFAALIVSVPYMIWTDMQKCKQMFDKYKEVHDNYKKVKASEMDKKDFNTDVTMKICQDIGIPEFIGKKALAKYYKDEL